MGGSTGRGSASECLKSFVHNLFVSLSLPDPLSLSLSSSSVVGAMGISACVTQCVCVCVQRLQSCECQPGLFQDIYSSH